MLVHIRIADEVLARVDEAAREEGRSRSGMVTVVLAEFFGMKRLPRITGGKIETALTVDSHGLRTAQASAGSLPSGSSESGVRGETQVPVPQAGAATPDSSKGRTLCFGRGGRGSIPRSGAKIETPTGGGGESHQPGDHHNPAPDNATPADMSGGRAKQKCTAHGLAKCERLTTCRLETNIGESHGDKN